MGADPFISEITILPFSWTPQGYFSCTGQSVPVSQNQALYSLLGNTFGGDYNNFLLPDLRGRVIVGIGQGQGLSNYVVGQKGGVESVTLTTAQIPAHNHALLGSSGNGASTPINNYSGTTDADGRGTLGYSSSPSGNMNAGAIGNAGGSQAHENRQPYLALNYCIANQGIYPMRP